MSPKGRFGGKSGAPQTQIQKTADRTPLSLICDLNFITFVIQGSKRALLLVNHALARVVLAIFVIFVFFFCGSEEWFFGG